MMDDQVVSIDEYTRYIAEKLAEAEVQAADPNLKRLSHGEFWREFGL